MKKRTKILVPIDFSACSENALEFAIQLADKIKADLHVLYVSRIDSTVGGNPATVSSAIQERVKQLRTQMKNFVQKVTDNIQMYLEKSPSIQSSVEWGNIETGIIQKATDKEVDYIIMGTQGETSTLEKYLGTMSSNIVKNAPCSVMVIPKGAEFNKRIELGYATDFSEVAHAEIQKVVELFAPFQPSIKCVHFNEKQVDNTDKIKEFKSYFAINIPELSLEFHNLPVRNTVEFMDFFIENQDINMLVMYKPKRNFFNSIFHKSFTQKMARHVTIPLLVLK